jgi:hypothetical protein
MPMLVVVGLLSTAVSGASAAGWLAPQEVSVAVRDLGFDAQGNAVAVGIGAGSGAEPVIRATTRPFGGQWGASVAISPSGDTEVSRPQVAVDPHGDAVAVWAAYDGTTAMRDVVRVATRPAGGGWSDAVTISDGSPFPGAAAYAVAIDAQGTATVIWSEFTGTAYTLRSTSCLSGGACDAPVEVTDTAGGTVTEPQLAIDGQGDATAVWLAADVLRSKSRSAGGTWDAEAADLSTNDHTANSPQVVVDPQGDATAVWESSSSSSPLTVRAARRAAGGDWVADGDLSPGFSPQVAVDAHGNATAVWTSPGLPSGTLVRSSSRTATGPWSAPLDLASSSTADDSVGYPGVAVDQQGNVTAIWARQSSSDVIAEAKHRVVGGAWSTPSVNLSVGRTINAIPAAGVDPQGDVTMVWSSSGSPWSGTSAIFDPIAPELKSTAVPATGVVGQAVAMSVDPSDAGSAVTTSWNFGDGLSATGAAVTHTYNSPGERTVTITGVDAAGNTTQTSQKITIDPAPVPEDPEPGPGAPPPPPPPPVLTAPVLSALRQSNPHWRTHTVKRGPRLPVGTTFRFTLDRAAQVRFAFSQIVTGRRVDGRCVRTTKANRGKSRCDRSEAVGTLRITGKAGANSSTFRGQLRGSTLKPGSYRLLVTATADGKTSKAASIRFTIVR